MVNISVVMGVPWVLEIISASLKSGGLDQISSQRIELALDFVNILAGLLIFVILICKKNVIDGLRVLCSSNLPNCNPDEDNELVMKSYSQGSQISSSYQSRE